MSKSDRVVSKGDVQLGIGVLVGLGIALWSANGGMKAMIDALNIVSEEEETRGFFKLNLISLLFTFGAIAALLVAMGAVVVLPLLLDNFGLGPVYRRARHVWSLAPAMAGPVGWPLRPLPLCPGSTRAQMEVGECWERFGKCPLDRGLGSLLILSGEICSL